MIGIRVEHDAALAQLVLARPERHNAVDLEMAGALQQALGQIADTPQVRALLIRAEGRDFGAGGDLGHIGREPESLERILTDLVDAAQDVVARVAELEIPVVCAARGAVAGFSLGLLWASDIVIASEDLTLETAFATVGVSSDGGSSWWLPRLVGMRRAQELLLCNRKLDASQALEWGLVTRVVSVDELDREAQRAAAALAAGPTVALGRMRSLLRDSAGPSLRDHLAAEHAAVLACARTADMREALAAFSERRAPVFIGR